MTICKNANTGQNRTTLQSRNTDQLFTTQQPSCTQTKDDTFRFKFSGRERAAAKYHWAIEPRLIMGETKRHRVGLRGKQNIKLSFEDFNKTKVKSPEKTRDLSRIFTNFRQTHQSVFVSSNETMSLI
jgi:hypothetical protein